MKKRKRKLKDVERQLESMCANLRDSALTRYAKDILYMGKIVPNADDPRAVAKFLAQEIFDSLPDGARKLRRVIEYRWNVCRAERAGYDFRRLTTVPLGMPKSEQRFIGQMLIALGEYLLKGQRMFDSVDVDAANIKKLQPTITVPEIITKLEKLHPNFTRDALDKRVRRLLKNIPREYLEPRYPAEIIWRGHLSDR